MDRATVFLLLGLHLIALSAVAQSTISTIAGTGISGYSGDGGPAINARVNAPLDVEVDATGNLYIADTFNLRVRKISPDGIITLLAGNGRNDPIGDGGPATAAGLWDPRGVAVDAAGNVYVADSNGQRIRRISPSGTITTVAGTVTSAGTPVRGFAGDGGPATNAQLAQPTGVAVDSAGNIYIADAGNNRIRKVNAAGVITTIAGNGTEGFSGDGGPATSAAMRFPQYVTVDAAGNVFIADTSNFRVRKVTPAGIITTIAGGGSSVPGDGGPATGARLTSVFDLEVEGGNLYFDDSGQYRIRKVNAAGIITTVAGNGRRGFSGDGGPALEAMLSDRQGLAVDTSGTLFLADSSNFRIRRVGGCLDSDGDSLCDSWETSGLDINGDGTIDLPLHQPPFSANPRRKDLFVEIDYMDCLQVFGACAPDDSHNHRPVPEALDDVIAAFAAAPLTNPDNSTGVTLHLMVDEALPEIESIRFRSDGPLAVDDFNDLKLGNPVKACGVAEADGHFGTRADRGSANCANILAARRQAFRYAIFGHNYNEHPGSSGIAELPGNDFLVTVGGWSGRSLNRAGGQRGVQAGTLMHEFGHTLNLRHGGSDNVNCKPNYLSVMNYSFQFSNIVPRPLDYSRQALAPLDERNLNELVGIAGPSNWTTAWGVNNRVLAAPANAILNWNGSPQTDAESSVMANIKHLPRAGCDATNSPLAVLAGFNDWPSLLFNFRDSADFADGALRTTVNLDTPEMTEAQATGVAEDIDFDGDGFSNFADTCPFIFNPDQRDSDRDGIGDVCDVTVATPVLALSASHLSFTAAPSASPAPQSVTVMSASGGSLNWTASAITASGGNWLSVSPAAGSAPSPIRVAVNTTGLAAGSYNGTITVSSSGSANSPLPVAVQLTLGAAGPAAPLFTSAGVTNGASFLQGASAGAIVTIFGTNLATNVSGVVLADRVPLPRSLAGTSVLVGGIPAPLFALTSLQINLQIPHELAGLRSVPVQVFNNGLLGNVVPVDLTPVHPGVFTIDGSAGAIIHANGQLVTASRPAARGEVVVVFATGLGPVDPSAPTGAPPADLSRTTNTPLVTVAGRNAAVEFSGLAPNFVGLNQLNIRVPPDAPAGLQDLVIHIAGQSSKPVKIAVE